MEYIFHMEAECLACKKVFKSNKNLNEHIQKFKLCSEWIELLKSKKEEFDFKLVERIQEVYESKTNIEVVSEFRCKSCHRNFSNQGNLNKHTNKSEICRKWKDFYKLKERPKEEDLTEVKAFENIPIYDSFIFKDVKVKHILDNIYLTDREAILELDIPIYLSVTIMPKYNAGRYKPLVLDDISFSNMEYTYDSVSYTDRYQEMCKIMSDLEKQNKNVLICCNNGYQRSTPFLCYYLVDYVKKVQTYEDVLDLIGQKHWGTNIDKIKKMLSQI